MKFWNAVARFCARESVFNVIQGLALRSPYTHIHNKDGSLYMGRFWLIKESKWRHFAVRLHYIATPDDGRHVHDHPRDFRTLILKNGYTERDIMGDTFIRYPGESVFHRAEYFHSIDSFNDPTVGTWTIFITYKKRHTWGFLIGGKKVPHWEYESIGSLSPADAVESIREAA